MEQMTPEQIAQSAQNLKKAFESGQISAEAFNKGMTDVTKGMQGYSAELSASLNQLGTASKKLGEAMLQGAQGASVYNDAMTSAAITSATVLTGMFGPLGAAVGALIKIFTFAVGQVNQMSDSLYKANQDMSKIGATGAEGMTGVFNNMQKFGYGIKDLGDMTALLAQNSNNLAMMSGTVEQGANQFANVAKGIKNSDLQRQFMNMGMSVNDINKGIGDYLSTQARLGIVSNETIEEQTQHAAEYLEQQDKLTKITGQNADKLKSNQQKAEQLENWNALLATMQPAEAAKMQAGFDRLAQTSEGAAMAFAASATGMVGLSKESSQQFMATGGASVELAQQFRKNIESGMDVTKASGILQQGWADATAANKNTAILMAKGGADAGMGKVNEITATAALAGGKALKATEAAETAQDGQAKGNDKLLNEHTIMLQKQMDARDSMQGLVKEGIGPVTEGMKGLSDIIDTILHPSWLWGGGKKEQKAGSGVAAVGKASGDKAALLDLIGKGETTTGDYNKLVGGKKGVASDADLTNMTIAQVMEYQKGMIAAGHSSTAVGKYQMIAATLAEQAKKAGLDINKVKFNAETQDLLAGQLIDQAGYGKVDNATLMTNLSKTWASLPKDQSGAGYYDGKNGNQARIGYDEMLSALNKTGGSGDTTTAKAGYQSTNLTTAQNNMPEAKTSSGANNDPGATGQASLTPYQKQVLALQQAQADANEARAKATKQSVTVKS